MLNTTRPCFVPMLCGLLLAVSATAEEPKPPSATTEQILKTVERLVNMKQPSRVMVAGEINFVQGNALFAASMAELKFATGIIYKNTAHALSRSAEEVSAVLPVLIWRTHETDPGFVNEGGGLQRLANRFACHPVRSQLP